MALIGGRASHCSPRRRTAPRRAWSPARLPPRPRAVRVAQSWTLRRISAIADALAFRAVYGEPHGAPELLPQFSSGVPERSRARRRPRRPSGLLRDRHAAGRRPAAPRRADRRRVFSSAGDHRQHRLRPRPQAGTHHPERHGNLYAYKASRTVTRPKSRPRRKASPGAGRCCISSRIPARSPAASTSRCRPRLRPGDTAGEVQPAFETSYARHALRRNHRRCTETEGCRRQQPGAGRGDGRRAAAWPSALRIDNLVKGAAGGAVQWMNRLWELPETSGLVWPAPAGPDGGRSGNARNGKRPACCRSTRPLPFTPGPRLRLRDHHRRRTAHSRPLRRACGRRPRLWPSGAARQRLPPRVPNSCSRAMPWRWRCGPAPPSCWSRSPLPVSSGYFSSIPVRKPTRTRCAWRSSPPAAAGAGDRARLPRPHRRGRRRSPGTPGKWYGFPQCPFEVGFIPRDDVAAAAAMIDDSVAAVIFEPVQGVAGAVRPVSGFPPELRASHAKRAARS